MLTMLRNQAQAHNELKARMERWKAVATMGEPLTNRVLITTICEEIVRRAFALAQQSDLRPHEVATFLLERSEAWLIAGRKVGEIGRDIPRTLGELGLLKLREGSDTVVNAPLSKYELAAVAKATKAKKSKLH